MTMIETITKEEKKRRVDELREQKRKLIEQMNARIQKAAAAETTRKRSEETRRKIVAGAWALSVMRGDGPEAEVVRTALDRYVTADRDRQLLGLPVTDAAAQ